MVSKVIINTIDMPFCKAMYIRSSNWQQIHNLRNCSDSQEWPNGVIEKAST